jgi:hypothetical protein
LLATKPAMSPTMIHATIDMRFSGCKDDVDTAQIWGHRRTFRT